MTKEICENCGEEKKEHYYREKYCKNLSNYKLESEKFKAKNHSLGSRGFDTPASSLDPKNHSRFQNHINVIKEAKRIKDGSDDEPSRSERSLSDKINEKLRSIKEFMEEENAIYSPDYPKKQAEQRLLRTLKKDVKEFIKNIEKWSYIDLGKDIMKIRYSKFEELAGPGLI